MLVYLEFSSFGFGCYWGSLVHTQVFSFLRFIHFCL